MKNKSLQTSVGIAVSLVVLATGAAMSAQDKYTVKVPGGLAFSEFKGYEGWQTISVSHNGERYRNTHTGQHAFVSHRHGSS